ncbi:MAG: glycosyltransferase family 2 protein [Spirochaetia bacterium]
MQIIIPMTGYGKRFENAGYDKLKPFIQVQNFPMIEWVTRMFKGDEENILFICRKSHLQIHPYIDKELHKVAPKANVFYLDDLEKKGPVDTLLKASHLIKDNEPVLISYCDYYMQWDYQQFKDHVIERDCDGAIPCYTGFHPHLLHKENLYATCQIDESQHLLEIKEKFSFEKDKMNSLHSPGVYYFKSGALLKKYAQKLIHENVHINGEYYMSLPYNYLVQDSLKVWCPSNVHYFCQWGTPKDLEEYLFWTNLILGDKSL